MYKYTKEDHVKYLLKKQQGNEKIPDDVLLKINNELINKNIKNPTARDIRNILKNFEFVNEFTAEGAKIYDFELSKYIVSIPSILNSVNSNRELTKITVEPMECPICFNDVNHVVKLECNHLFCEDCVSKIEDNSMIKCPLCRKVQDVIKTYHLTDEQMKTILEDYKNNSHRYEGKNMIISNIIKEIANHRGIKLE